MATTDLAQLVLSGDAHLFREVTQYIGWRPTPGTNNPLLESLRALLISPKFRSSTIPWDLSPRPWCLGRQQEPGPGGAASAALAASSGRSGDLDISRQGELA